jgi:hypothetical protein
MIKTDYVSERKEGSGDGFVAGNGDGRAYISLVMAYGEDGCFFLQSGINQNSCQYQAGLDSTFHLIEKQGSPKMFNPLLEFGLLSLVSLFTMVNPLGIPLICGPGAVTW